ncbi:MAG: polysaccharide deacetylase family protein [Saprospiraceae bacterium]|nr:polysaccharide deacetylase family protein [Candidatus Opimibacter iunctus]
MEDVRLIRLFDENNIIGTFNLNSGLLSTTKTWPQSNGPDIVAKYVSKDSLLLIYNKHEIAAHSATHKDFKNLGDSEILEEVTTDINNLNKLTKRKIVSMAYPFGNSNQHIANLIGHTGLTNARSVTDTYTFDLPDTFLLWHPTCHDSKALELVNDYLSLDNHGLSVFYVWGHSWEFNDAKRWDDISEFCKKIGNRKDIWYVGCGAFTDYQLALKRLTITKESISNPIDNKEVWFRQNGVLKVLKPGKSIKAGMQ